MAERKTQYQRIQEQVIEFNERHPVGTKAVYHWPHYPQGFELDCEDFETKTRSPAVAIEKPAHAIIQVEGVDGWVRLEEVEIGGRLPAAKRSAG